jgi:hypothetical protein
VHVQSVTAVVAVVRMRGVSMSGAAVAAVAASNTAIIRRLLQYLHQYCTCIIVKGLLLPLASCSEKH